MAEQESLIESGTILYLREHTEQLKMQNSLEQRRQNIIMIVFGAFFLLITGLLFYIHYFNVLNNVVARCMGN